MIDESQTAPQELINFQGENSRDLSYRSIEAVNNYLERSPHQVTCKPALNLHMYNFFADKPNASETETKHELSRYQKIVKRELLEADDKDLPSIGCEVEVPYSFFPFEESSHSQIAIDLNRMGIKVKREVTERAPTELELPPTTSASVQSRMILELRKMGKIPLDNTFASLHITLGIPMETESTMEMAFFMSDLLTYGFIPASRVENRGKAEYYESVKISRNNYQSIKEGYDQGKRVEFRTPRIIGSKTYRLLEELQSLGKLLISEDPKFIEIRQQFRDEMIQLLTKYDLDINLPEDDEISAAEAIKEAIETWKTNPKNPNLINDSRNLMSEYAQKVKVASNNLTQMPLPLAA